MRDGTLALLMIALLWSCSPFTQAVARSAEIRVQKVKPATENAALRRHYAEELGCDGCVELTHKDLTGREERYMVNPDAGVSLSLADVRGAVIGESAHPGTRGGTAFGLVLKLSERGTSTLAQLDAGTVDMVVNHLGDEILGVVPFMLDDRDYLVGMFRTLHQAREARASLGLPAETGTEAK
jgi:hypothetical protein